MQVWRQAETDDVAALRKALATASVDDVDPEYLATPLHWAAKACALANVKALLAAQADPNAANKFQATPLHWACRRGEAAREVVIALLQAGADARLCDVNDETPVDIARAAGAVALLELLSEPQKSASRSATPHGEAEKTKLPPSVLPAVAPAPPPPASQKAAPLRASVQPVSISGASDKDTLALQIETKRQQAIIEELNNTIDRLQRERLQLEGSLQTTGDLRRRVEALQKEKIRLEVELKERSLEEELGRKRLASSHGRAEDQAEARRLRDELEKASARERSLQLQLEDTAQDKVDLQQRQDSAEKRHAEEAAQLREKLATALRENAKLDIEARNNAELRESIRTLQKEKALLELEVASVDELNQAISNLQESKAQLESRLHTRERELAEAQAAADTLSRQCSAADGELQELRRARDQLQIAQAANASLEAKLHTFLDKAAEERRSDESHRQSAEVSAESLRRSLEALSLQHDAGSTKLKEAERQVAELTVALRKAEASAADLHSRVLDFDRLRRQLDQQVAANKELQQELQMKELEMAERKIATEAALRRAAEAEAAAQEVRSAAASAESARQQLTELAVAAKERDAQIGALQDSLRAATTEKQALASKAADAADLREELAKVRKQAQTVAAELEAARNALALERQQRLAAEEAVQSSTATERDEFAARIRTAERDNFRLEFEARSLREEVAQLLAETREQLQQRVERESKLLADHRAETAALHTRITELETESATRLRDAQILRAQLEMSTPAPAVESVVQHKAAAPPAVSHQPSAADAAQLRRLQEREAVLLQREVTLHEQEAKLTEAKAEIVAMRAKDVAALTEAKKQIGSLQEQLKEACAAPAVANTPAPVPKQAAPVGPSAVDDTTSHGKIIKDLREQVEALQRERVHLQLQLEDSANSVLRQAEAAQLAKFREENNRLRSELATTQAVLQDRQKQIKAQDEAAELQGTIDKLQKEKLKMGVELRVMVDLRKKVDSLEEENTKLHFRVEDLEEQLSRKPGSRPGSAMSGRDAEDLSALRREKLRLEVEVQEFLPLQQQVHQLRKQKAAQETELRVLADTQHRIVLLEKENAVLKQLLGKNEQETAVAFDAGPSPSFAQRAAKAAESRLAQNAAAPASLPPLSQRTVSPRPSSAQMALAVPRGGSPAVNYFQQMLQWTNERVAL